VGQTAIHGKSRGAQQPKQTDIRRNIAREQPRFEIFTISDPRVAKSMETLKALTAKLGAPKVEGNDPVGGKDAPGLYFGTAKATTTLTSWTLSEENTVKG
jgi:hypothetical protein